MVLAPPDLCFDLARDVSVHTQTAAFSDERVVLPGRLSGCLELGEVVTFEGKHFGIHHRFTARIVEFRRPHRFTDEMVNGPFRSFRHCHEFHAKATGTLMVDALDWQSPYGPLGRLADTLLVVRHMQRFITAKQRRLKELAESMER